MYGQIPYMMPGAIMQTAPTVANGLANASNLGNALNTARTGVGSLLTRVNWSSLLSNAQKTLNVVNQAIPLYYQAKPVFKNIRALGKIGKEFTKMGANGNNNSNVTTDNNKTVNQGENNSTQSVSDNVPEPTFFL